uniref:p61 n=2 Tax=Citrus tristeza virus TaxID=12162 RepID=W8D0V7_9CLOS|nr:p61 [Citrus tristeza virus]
MMSSHHVWGSLFRKFYGEAIWKEYLSESTRNFDERNVSLDHTLSSGVVVRRQSLLNAPQGTFENELALLYNSVVINDFVELTGMPLKSLMTGVEDRKVPDELISVDPHEVGCRFTLNDVESYLISRGEDSTDVTAVEHSWCLSNSCGKLLSSTEIDAYKTMVFTKIFDSGVFGVATKLETYLSYCISLYKKHCMKDDDYFNLILPMFNCLMKVLASLGLFYEKHTDNPLLTGMLIEFCLENKVYYSTFKVNLDNVRLFKSKVLPVVLTVWVISEPDDPVDERTLVPFDPTDFVLDIPKLNIHDTMVVVGNQIRHLEHVVESDALDDLSQHVDLNLAADNPDLRVDLRWAGMFVYYGIYRCAADRVVERPALFNLPQKLLSQDDGESCLLRMSSVETLFNLVQKVNKDINIRRQFMGHHSKVALRLYRNLGLKFPPISSVRLPAHHGYLYVDFYKRIPDNAVDADELESLRQLRSSVDVMCKDRVSITPPPFNRHRRGSSRILRGRGARGASSRYMSRDVATTGFNLPFHYGGLHDTS